LDLLGLIKTSDVLQYWRDHESTFPTLAKMARDFLAIPATGVGVERLFNSARDVCHYRRGRLLPDTIHAIMIQMCTDRFNLKQEYARIAEDVNTEEDDWDLLDNIDDEDKDPTYISDVESEDELDLSRDETNLPDSVSIISRQQNSTVSSAFRRQQNSTASQTLTSSGGRNQRSGVSYYPGKYRALNNGWFTSE
jgi:hypothetical protein